MTPAGWLCEWDGCNTIAAIETRTIAAGRLKLCKPHARQYAQLNQGQRDRVHRERQPPREWAGHAGPSTIPDRATAYNEHRWYPIVRATAHRPRFRPRNQ